jgi:hypothetical protein
MNAVPSRAFLSPEIPGLQLYRVDVQVGDVDVAWRGDRPGITAIGPVAAILRFVAAPGSEGEGSIEA